jgi:Bacterial Ig domain
MPLLARRRARGLVCLLSLACLLTGSVANAQTFKLAYWNIKSGKGQIALPGYPATFVDTSNCTDPTQPLNAWGVGLVPQELAKLAADPRIVALGLGEAWICGNSQRVRAALGWAATVTDQNGVSIVARYGFAGPLQWKQLDTSKAANPTDTKWVVRARVCLDAVCSNSIEVFTAHWGGGGSEVMDVQAQETVTFMSALPAGEPHVLIGDLNVFETSTSCASTPLFTPLAKLRNANYTDAWNYLNGSAAGYTGMTNRAGCGNPIGSTFKRIDYAWSRNLLPVSMQRFAMVPPGEGAPSDHYGIIIEYPSPGSSAPPDTTPPIASITSPAPAATTSGVATVVTSASDDRAVVRVEVLLDGALLGSAVAAPYQIAWDTTRSANGGHSLKAVAYDAAGNAGHSSPITVSVYNAPAPPPPPPAAEIVVHAARVGTVAGAWRSIADPTAASGARLWHPNAGAPKLTVPLASPANYFEITFQATAGVPYRLWMRGMAEANYWGNDSVFVQFSGSVTPSGAPVNRIGTTSAMSSVLEDCSGCGVSGWGWQDNAYGIGVLGPLVYFAQSGVQTMRVQGREDGISIDQVALSPVLYLTQAPGAVRNDATILAETVAPPAPPPPSGAFTWGATFNSTTSPGGLIKSSGCNGCNAGGLSVETIATGGFVEFTPSSGHRLYAGLGRPDATPGTLDIAYSFSFWPDGGWDIRERNGYRAEGTFAAGDRFRIAVENGTVKYFKNATLVYVSTVAPTAPTAFNVSLLTLSASVTNAVLQLP